MEMLYPIPSMISVKRSFEIMVSAAKIWGFFQAARLCLRDVPLRLTASWFTVL